MATLSEYAAKVRNFYCEEMIFDINNLEDSEAENMVNIAISHVSIAFNLLDQANMANHRWLVQQSSDARKMEEAYETFYD